MRTDKALTRLVLSVAIAAGVAAEAYYSWPSFESALLGAGALLILVMAGTSFD